MGLAMADLHGSFDAGSGASAAGPPLVPGVYNYCDRWCERCRFRLRCRVGVECDHIDGELAMGMSPELAVPAARDGSEQASATTDVPGGGGEPSWPGETGLEETTRLVNQSFEERSRHPLSLLARDYVDITQGVMSALRPMVHEVDDEVSIAAVETIDRLDMVIGAKIWRAVGSAIDHEIFGDHLQEAQSDANGSAKLARLMIAESRDAWRALAQSGRARADGIPRAMVGRLEALDDAVAREFPLAMSFVRPGFDEEEPAQ